MFPLVPYHALPKLHELIKADCPAPYDGLLEAYREIVPTLLRQAKDADLLCSAPASTPLPTGQMHRQIRR